MVNVYVPWYSSGGTMVRTRVHTTVPSGSTTVMPCPRDWYACVLYHLVVPWYHGSTMMVPLVHVYGDGLCEHPPPCRNYRSQIEPPEPHALKIGAPKRVDRPHQLNVLQAPREG